MRVVFSNINDSLLRESHWSVLMLQEEAISLNKLASLVLTCTRYHKIHHNLASGGYFLKIKPRFFLKLDAASIFVVIRAEIMFYKKKLALFKTGGARMCNEEEDANMAAIDR